MKVLKGIDGSTLFHLIDPRKYLHSWVANDAADVFRAFVADESAEDYFETIN